MAGANISPRQKMIGMMYLVLTALLALNVSKEILDSFVTVNNGLENTGKSFDKDITALYTKFDEKKSIDPMRVMNSWKKAQEARKLSKEMNAFIDALKKTLLRETEGYTNKEEDTIRLQYVKGLDNYDTPTNILCGETEDGKNGQANVLRQKLEKFEKDMLALLSPEVRKDLHLTIDTDDPTDGGEYRTWEMKTFYHSPLAADITILSKIQDDVKSAEADVLDALLRETDSDVIPFDTVAARVIATTNYVMQGESYEAEIFLAAFNKTLNPQILLGKYDSVTGKMVGPYDSVKVQNGMGKYFADASREGIFTYEGVINMTTPKGAVKQYPFRSEYIVARPALTVSAEKMKVMYAGLANPIKVSVPGVPNEKLRVSCDNGRLIPKGNGEFDVVSPRVGKAKVTVIATTENGEEKNMGVSEFEVKPLPAPTTSMSGVTGSRATPGQIGTARGLIPKYGADFVFQATPRVVSFRIAISKGNVFVCDDPVTGNMFTQKHLDIMSKLRKGDRVIISEVKAKGPDDNVVSSNDINIVIQ